MDGGVGGGALPALDEMDEERRIRTELACAYRLVEHFGWTELIYGHLTMRLPGSDHRFLINPFGLAYDEVTASNLIEIDLDGNVVNGDHEANFAGFVIHSAIHMADNDNHCVMHTHTRAGMAVAALEEGLLPISMAATTFFGEIAYHDYEGVSLYLDERGRLLEALGDRKAMILRNHGLLTVGSTVPEAFSRLYRLERACQIQIDAAAAGTLRVLGDDVAAKSGRDTNAFAGRGGNTGMGRLEFDALMRRMDRVDPSYRD